MTQFILNNDLIQTIEPTGLTVLDFVRYKKHLKGTKIGCREGDCGACTILVGSLENDTVLYHSMTSCLTPLANVQGKHVVTVEGINAKELTPIQEALVAESGTQCGFCTVGFVMSMTGLSIQNQYVAQEDTIAAIDGNICRCTGYKSIERAAQRLTDLLQTRDLHGSALDFAIDNKIVPPYFRDIKKRLIELNVSTPSLFYKKKIENEGEITYALGGGTDLYVQKHDTMPHTQTIPLFDEKILRGVTLVEDYFEIGGAATVSDMKASSPMNGALPFLQKHLKLVSSTPIRNMATVGGNLVNASPIGDLTIFLLAFDATIILQNTEGGSREIYLKDFYKGYKTMDKKEGEILTKIRFKNPELGDTHFNFEKVCKRTHLDIASVNSALFFKTEKDVIVEAHVSIGGVAPIPLYLTQLSAFLQGKSIKNGENIEWLDEANTILQSEINPISDVRGSSDYKRLLAKQLFKAHFVELFSSAM
jgi:xanthine dehydrogenase small subunit